MIAFICLKLFSKEDIYFLPDDKIAFDRLIDSINLAKNEIKIGMYAFTSYDIAKSLKDVAKNGIKVEILADFEFNVDSNYSQVGYLAKYENIDVFLISGDERNGSKGKFHQKFMIIDNSLAIFGSANFTKSAFGKNYEFIIFSDELEKILKFREFFEKTKSLGVRF